ncbi:MAG TPA: hypothetical protein VIE46_09195 [Gemmatimonadales bacterium]|jgi:hypothetical protein
MLPAALEQERLLLAVRLLSEIQRRHALPQSHQLPLSPALVDRFLAAFLPETREGEPAPRAVEYAFTPTLDEAMTLLRDVVTESPGGWGAAVYIHDLDTGLPFEHEVTG